MARQVIHEINWKPRSQRNLELLARREHLQLSLPCAGSDVLAGDENGVEPVAPDVGLRQLFRRPVNVPWLAQTDAFRSLSE